MPDRLTLTHIIRRTIALQIVSCVLAAAGAGSAAAQDTPLLSGGVAFFSSTPGGNTTYMPIVEPLAVIPLGSHLLVESRAALLETWAPGAQGYRHSHFIGLTYIQGDYLASPHVTVVAGSFLVPFGTYNERLSPVWIGNFKDGPLIANIGAMSTGTGVGGELRGSAIARDRFSVDYAAYFSVRSGMEQFDAERSSGGRVDLYLPEARLEVGTSYGRLLEGAQENFYGTHLWWEPKDTGFRLRSEFARGAHAMGYWAEADYRLSRFGGEDSFAGRIEPVFRMQQTFRLNAAGSDGVPAADTQRADFGLDYNLPHNTRILTSYARQFSSAGNRNVWETGIVYRFLFPAWKGRKP